MKALKNKTQETALCHRVVPKSVLGSENGTYGDFARRCLCSSVASSKEWAGELGVSERVVRAWASGEKSIPEPRLSKIFLAAKKFHMRLRAIEEFLDRTLLEQYGEI